MLFFLISIFGQRTPHPDANMSNDCLFVEQKEVVNYADSFFLQKIDELRLCPDVVLRKKTPVNHTPSGLFTICLPTPSHSLLIKANIQLTVIHCVTFDFVLAKQNKTFTQTLQSWNP